jgi:hypothetical protein
LTLSLSGTAVQEIDRRAGKYRMTLEGQGTGISTRTEASGISRAGRFMPVETRAVHHFRNRENTSTTSYDYARQRAEIHAVTHTLLMGRRRQVDDVLAIPPGRHVDDLISAELNFADNTLDRDPDGTYYTWVVRRARADNEGPDDVSPTATARSSSRCASTNPDPATGGLTALIDITRFSSWARVDQPARVTFARPTARVRSIPPLYGTTLKVRVTGTA